MRIYFRLDNDELDPAEGFVYSEDIENGIFDLYFRNEKGFWAKDVFRNYYLYDREALEVIDDTDFVDVFSSCLNGDEKTIDMGAFYIYVNPSDGDFSDVKLSPELEAETLPDPDEQIIFTILSDESKVSACVRERDLRRGEMNTHILGEDGWKKKSIMKELPSKVKKELRSVNLIELLLSDRRIDTSKDFNTFTLIRGA